MSHRRYILRFIGHFINDLNRAVPEQVFGIRNWNVGPYFESRKVLIYYLSRSRVKVIERFKTLIPISCEAIL